MAFNLNNGFGTSGTGKIINEIDWDGVKGKPVVFPPDAHQHGISDVGGLRELLDSKVAASALKTVGGQSLLGSGDIPISAVFNDGELKGMISGLSERVDALEVGDVLERPAVIGTIADRVYSVGQTVATTDLRTKFAGASYYVISPPIAAAVINGYNLDFNTTSAVAGTLLTVMGGNGKGLSDPVTFNLTVNDIFLTVATPLPDQILVSGSEDVIVPLDDYFSGADSYAVTPEGQGATVVGRTLVLSPSAVRSVEMTVRAMSGTGQSVTDVFLFVVPQIVTAPSVSLPTPGMFDTMTLGNLPGYATLANPASYASTDPQGGVDTITFEVNGTPGTANTVLKTGDVVEVIVAGTGGEIPLTHALGTVQWTWATAVNEAAQTLTFSDNPAAPDALAISVPATIGDTDYLFQATLAEIRTRPIFAQGYPKLIQPDDGALEAGDTISADVGVVIVQGSPTIIVRLTRGGSIDTSKVGTEYQLTTSDYDTDIGFAVTVNDGRNLASGSTSTVLMAAPDVPDVTMPQLVGVGPGVAVESGEITVSQPSEVQSGDKMALILSVYGPETDPTIPGWTHKISILPSTNTAYSKTVIYERTSTGGGTPVVFTSVNAVAANIVAFRNTATISAMGPGHRDNSPYVVTGGAAPENSLVLGVVSTRVGTLSSKVDSFTNPALTFEEKSDVRTVSGTAASLTLLLARVPEGTSEFGDSLVTFSSGTTVRNSRIHLSIQGAA